MMTDSAIRKPAQIDFPGFDIDEDDTVVDVGCGDGPVCVYAGHRGADVIGLDIEPELIARAEVAMKGVPARSYRGIVSDADPIPLPDGTATVVVATEVLEHVDDPRILSELFRIGKPGARYLISVPDPASEQIMRSVAPSWYFEKPIHIRVFEHEVLDRCCTRAGLTIEARHSTGFYFSMYWTMRMAIGMEHKYAEQPSHPVFGQLDGVFNTLLAAPHGQEALQTLDRLIPKSQVVIATKPGVPERPRQASSRSTSGRGPDIRAEAAHGPDRSPRRPFGRVIRDLIRDGSIDVAGLNLCWSVRRSPGRPS